MTTRTAIERVHAALRDVREGRMVILVDDEDRENEGDLVLAAEACTPEAVNFMVKHARGLVCLTLTEEQVRRLDLPMMVDENRSQRSTAFTVSIEAREGVSTGISAADRCRTILVASADGATPRDVVSPGHVFPLRARPGGVLQRTGHTEGSVDLARLAGMRPAGVICEIMNDDGSMARMPDLERFATEHDLRILSIADLVQYRLEHEQIIEKRLEGEVDIEGRTWRAHLFHALAEGRADGVRGQGGREFLALTLGTLDETPTLVRMHTGSVLGDVFDVSSPGRLPVRSALRRIAAEGRGVVVFIAAPLDLTVDVSAHIGLEVKRPRLEGGEVLREYGLGAQVLRALGLRRIRLLTNRPRKIAGVEGYGLEVLDQIAETDPISPLH